VSHDIKKSTRQWHKIKNVARHTDVALTCEQLAQQQQQQQRQQQRKKELLILLLMIRIA
jgi:hypothetical protein